ncbi:MAG TPA: FAD/NAD(P)-binding protein [Solirubrobacteraceae bacterium]|nr:FAD/NAD(P)-binding protein [Solirubrobacteraceae bacterium]
MGALTTIDRAVPPNPHTPLVAIVGGGCAGTLVAANLLRRCNEPLRIAMIERSGRFGAGVAYATDDSQHLLNVPAQGMSAFSEEPSHFVDWSARRLGGSVGRASYLPRGIYGEYLRSVLSDSQARGLPRRTLELIHNEAVGINRARTGMELRLAGGASIACDRVVLATGSLESTGIAELPRDPRVIGDQWAPDPLPTDGSTELTLIVGTGLSAVDATLSICAGGGRVVALSRGGRLPFAHLPGLRTTAPPPAIPQEPVTLATLERLVRAHVAEMQRHDYDWRDAIDGLRPVSSQLWACLAPAERRRFLDERLRTWETRRHRMAPAVATRLHELLDSGRVRRLAGTVLAARANDGAMEVDVASSRSAPAHTLTCARIVVCTGAGTDIRRSTNPLLQALLADGGASPDPLALGLRSTGDGALLNSEGHADERVFTLGALRRGELWETTAVQEIRAQAECLAHTIERSLSTFRDSLDRQFAEHPDNASNAITRPVILSGH